MQHDACAASLIAAHMVAMIHGMLTHKPVAVIVSVLRDFKNNVTIVAQNVVFVSDYAGQHNTERVSLCKPM